MSLFAISDGLKALRSKLRDFEHAPVVLDPEDARALAVELNRLAALALIQEHEISRHRWNQAARTDREHEMAVMIEATRPGTNLRLLAPVSRPFSDGHPRGAA